MGIVATDFVYIGYVLVHTVKPGRLTALLCRRDRPDLLVSSEPDRTDYCRTHGADFKNFALARPRTASL